MNGSDGDYDIQNHLVISDLVSILRIREVWIIAIFTWENVSTIGPGQFNLQQKFCRTGALGRGEKPKSWKSKNGQADYLPRHSPDVRTVFEIQIRPFVSCEIGLTQFTEKGIRFTKPR